VDSGSTDATVSIAKRYPVKLLSIDPADFTFGRSLNLGIGHASADQVVFASAHVYPVYPDWLERLLEPFENPQIALVYGKQRGNHTTHFSEKQQFAKLYLESSAVPQAHAFCNNANAAIRRDLWLRRQYDEELPGLEDLEWALWARSEGYQLGYVAEAEVIHVHAESPRQVYNRYRREAIALKRLRPFEHFGLVDFVRFYISNVASDARHALQQRQFGQAWANLFWYRLMQLWGTHRGFAHRGPVSPDLKRTFYYPRTFRSSEKEPARPVEPLDYGSIGGEPRKG
jgi:GT2 family glycosyltransferase